MISQKIRSMFVLAVLAVALFAGSATPASAQIVGRELKPAPMGCYLNGELYPLGTTLHFDMPDPRPDVNMTCTLAFKIVDGRLHTVYKWVYS